MLETLRAADFTDLVGSALAVHAFVDGSPIDLVLTLDAVDVGTAPSPEFREPFTLQLSGPADPVLGQGTYGIEHPRHGRLELFMVPHAATPTGARYAITLA